MQTLRRCSLLCLGLLSACFSAVVGAPSSDEGSSDAGDNGRAEPGAAAAAARDAGSDDTAPESPRLSGSGAAAPGITDAEGAAPDGTVPDDAPLDDRPGASAVLDVLSASVVGPTGAPPRKGDALTVQLLVRNSGAAVSGVRLTALVSSTRFSDFTSVPLASVDVTLGRGDNEVTLSGGPFLSDVTRQKEYALGRGSYKLSVRSELDGMAASVDERLTGATFTLGASDALFGVVVYDQGYFDEIQGFTGTPHQYLDRVYSRPSQVFTPRSAADPDGPGSYQDFPRGFDQMLGVRQLFRIFPGFAGRDLSGEGWCEAVAAYAAQVLGMPAAWTTPGTDPAHHGFDFALGLTPDLGGGVNCDWLDVSVGGFIDRDADRQEIIVVHESGHMFGAPHCDDEGNGSGGPLQGYVMCSGEVHPNYPAQFVWHSSSRAAMYNHWD